MGTKEDKRTPEQKKAGVIIKNGVEYYPIPPSIPVELLREMGLTKPPIKWTIANLIVYGFRLMVHVLVAVTVQILWIICRASLFFDIWEIVQLVFLLVLFLSLMSLVIDRTGSLHGWNSNTLWYRSILVVCLCFALSVASAIWIAIDHSSIAWATDSEITKNIGDMILYIVTALICLTTIIEVIIERTEWYRRRKILKSREHWGYVTKAELNYLVEKARGYDDPHYYKENVRDVMYRMNQLNVERIQVYWQKAGKTFTDDDGFEYQNIPDFRTSTEEPDVNLTNMWWNDAKASKKDNKKQVKKQRGFSEDSTDWNAFKDPAGPKQQGPVPKPHSAKNRVSAGSEDWDFFEDPNGSQDFGSVRSNWSARPSDFGSSAGNDWRDSAYGRSVGSNFESARASGFGRSVGSNFESARPSGFGRSVGSNFESARPSDFGRSVGSRFGSGQSARPSGLGKSVESKFESSQQNDLGRSVGSRFYSSAWSSGNHDRDSNPWEDIHVVKNKGKRQTTTAPVNTFRSSSFDDNSINDGFESAKNSQFTSRSSKGYKRSASTGNKPANDFKFPTKK